MENAEIMVSVIVTTYNHELYIRQALEGILMQSLSYKYEIIIGDDCSTDRTGDIIRAIQLSFPQIIKIITNKKNVGEQKNTCNLLKLCKGKYIAVCEGDDYWTDDTKLQQQIDFLENNPQYIGTAHNVLCVDAKGRRISKNKVDFPYQKQHVYGKENALNYEELGQMSSYVYRNIWLNASKRDFLLFEKCVANTDLKLNATLGLIGDIFYFEDIWSCRRRLFSGAGWTAHVTNNNVGDYTYISCLNLKEYVKERFHENMDVDEFLFYVWYQAIKVFIKDKTQENLKVIKKIYSVKGNSKWQMACDILRVGIMEKLLGTRAFAYERIYQTIREYGYSSPVIYWVADNEKCIYVQNPKVACSSIKAAMYHLSDNIKDYEDVHNILLKKGNKLKKEESLKEEFPDVFKFTFVRNPYERLASCYVNKFITDRQKNKDNYFKEYFIQSIQRVSSFNEFVCKIFIIPDKLSDWHFRSQHCMTHNKMGQPQVEYIGKYSNLQNDFDIIATKYHFSELKWHNKSCNYDWRDLYDLKTAIAVYIRYHKDFKIFGYQNELSRLVKYIIEKRKITGRGK